MSDKERGELLRLLRQADEDPKTTRRLVSRCMVAKMRASDIRAEIQGLNNDRRSTYHRKNLMDLGFQIGTFTRLKRAIETGAKAPHLTNEDESMEEEIKMEPIENEPEVVDLSETGDSEDEVAHKIKPGHREDKETINKPGIHINGQNDKSAENHTAKANEDEMDIRDEDNVRMEANEDSDWENEHHIDKETSGTDDNPSKPDDDSVENSDETETPEDNSDAGGKKNEQETSVGAASLPGEPGNESVEDSDETEAPEDNSDDGGKKNDQETSEGATGLKIKNLSCILCDHPFKYICTKTLAEHYKNVHKRKKCPVNQCMFISKKNEELRRHQALQHVTKVKCRGCLEAFENQGKLYQHKSTSKVPACRFGTKVKCRGCRGAFEDSVKLYQHKFTSKVPACGLKVFKCTECEYMTRFPDRLQGHETKKHGRKMNKVLSKKVTDKETDGEGGDLLKEANISILVSKVEKGLRAANPGIKKPEVRSLRIEYRPPSGPGNNANIGDCLQIGNAGTAIKREGSEDALICYTTTGESQEVRVKTVTIFKRIKKAGEKYLVLARPPMAPPRTRSSSCPGTCSKELSSPGKMLYVGCVPDQKGHKRCSNGTVDERKRSVSRLPGQSLPRQAKALRIYKEYLGVVDEVADEATSYVKQLMPEKFANHVAKARGSKCRVGSGDEERAFSSVSQILQAGTHLHRDASCQEGTVSVVAVFGPDETGGNHRRQCHIVSDYGLADGEEKAAAAGLEFHLMPGDLHYEDAAVIRHGSTSPQEGDQERLALVLYLAGTLNLPNHGKEGEEEIRNTENKDGNTNMRFKKIPNESQECQGCRGIVLPGKIDEHLERCHGNGD